MQLKDETFYKTIQSFLETYLVKQKNYSINTKKSYKKALKLLLEFFKETQSKNNYEVGFEDITYENISSFMDWLKENRKCSDQTANLRLMAIRSFTKYAGVLDPERIAKQIEVANVPTRKTSPKIVEFLSADALDTLFQQPNTSTKIGFRDYCFLTLMYDIAARCQELLDLKISDMELSSPNPRIFLTGKGNKKRCVPVSDSVARNMREYIEAFHPSDQRSGDSYVFFTFWHGTKHQMSPDAVALFLKKYAAAGRESCSEIPVKMHPHVLRHTRAMHLYRGGMPLPLLSEFMGHANINTTRIYAWSDTEMKRDAIKKAKPDSSSEVKAIWQDDEDMIRKLYGLD